MSKDQTALVPIAQRTYEILHIQALNFEHLLEQANSLTDAGEKYIALRELIEDANSEIEKIPLVEKDDNNKAIGLLTAGVVPLITGIVLALTGSLVIGFIIAAFSGIFGFDIGAAIGEDIDEKRQKKEQKALDLQLETPREKIKALVNKAEGLRRALLSEKTEEIAHSQKFETLYGFSEIRQHFEDAAKQKKDQKRLQEIQQQIIKDLADTSEPAIENPLPRQASDNNSLNI